MDWLSSNWIWVILIGGMVGMHLFGHGGHGSKGGHGGCCGRGDSKNGERKSEAAK